MMAQVAPAARVEAQVLVCVNELSPAMETATPVRGALPVFLRVMAWEVAAVPCTVEAKVRVLGVRLTAATNAPGHPFTTLATFSEPRPVARS